MTALSVVVGGCIVSGPEVTGSLPASIDDGINVLSVPPDSRPPSVSIEQAMAIAQQHVTSSGRLHSVERRLLPHLERATAWIVVFQVHEERPCGPAPAPDAPAGNRVCVITLAGAAIDDQTGERLMGFEEGTVR